MLKTQYTEVTLSALAAQRSMKTRFDPEQLVVRAKELNNTTLVLPA